MKAAEALEVAGIGEDSDEELQYDKLQYVQEKLQYVQEAVDTARQHHRERICQAVHSIAPQATDNLAFSGELSSRSPLSEVEKAVAAQANSKPRGAMRALMKTRASVGGSHVHCGPRKTQTRPVRPKAGGD